MNIITKLVGVIVCSLPLAVSAFSGHNGINFDMTQKQVEIKGFVCNPPKEESSSIKAECKHMDFTGVAFSFPTNDYTIYIGPSGKVDIITADFSKQLSLTDNLKLYRNIEHFFPTKYEKGAFYSEGLMRRTEWRAKNNASAVLLFINAMPPVRDATTSITFTSPRRIANADK